MQTSFKAPGRPLATPTRLRVVLFGHEILAFFGFVNGWPSSSTQYSEVVCNSPHVLATLIWEQARVEDPSAAQ